MAFLWFQMRIMLNSGFGFVFFSITCAFGIAEVTYTVNQITLCDAIILLKTLISFLHRSIGCEFMFFK